jgi:hypothetical protein
MIKTGQLAAITFGDRGLRITPEAIAQAEAALAVRPRRRRQGEKWNRELLELLEAP